MPSLFLLLGRPRLSNSSAIKLREEAEKSCSIVGDPGVFFNAPLGSRKYLYGNFPQGTPSNYNLLTHIGIQITDSKNDACLRLTHSMVR